MSAPSHPEVPVSGVTCVIPTHGRPDFLAEAIASVSAQTHAPSRLIVVSDDDSAETTAVVASASAASPFPIELVHRTTGSAGASASRNLGAELATTELVAFLDDDDLWNADHLERGIAALEAEDTDASVAAFYRFTADGRTGETHPEPGQSAADAFARSPGVTGSTLLVRRAVFQKLGGYDAALPVNNDTDFFLRFLQAGCSYAVVDDTTVGVRKHGQGQLTDNSPHRVAGGWLFIDKHKGSFPKGAAQARKFGQHRMAWRIRPARPATRAKALAGMLLNVRGAAAGRVSTGPSAGAPDGLERIRSKDDLRTFLEADYLAQNVLGLSPLARLRKPTVRFVKALRTVEYHRRPGAPLSEIPLRVLANRRLARLSVATGISILPGTFGKGLGLPHYGSIVVHSKARFGNFCVLQNATNIGVSNGGVPSGGDFIYIAPGAVIYGDITIGSYSVIGANAVISRDVPAGTTWAGVPARQISETNSKSIMIPGVAALIPDDAPAEGSPIQ